MSWRSSGARWCAGPEQGATTARTSASHWAPGQSESESCWWEPATAMARPSETLTTGQVKGSCVAFDSAVVATRDRVTFGHLSRHPATWKSGSHGQQRASQRIGPFSTDLGWRTLRPHLRLFGPKSAPASEVPPLRRDWVPACGTFGGRASVVQAVSVDLSTPSGAVDLAAVWLGVRASP